MEQKMISVMCYRKIKSPVQGLFLNDFYVGEEPKGGKFSRRLNYFKPYNLFVNICPVFLIFYISSVPKCFYEYFEDTVKMADKYDKSKSEDSE